MNAPTQRSPQDAMRENLMLRQALLSSAPRMRKNLGTFGGTAGNGTPGGITRINLFNVGVITKLVLNVTADVTIGTANTTLSPKAPFNVISNLQLVDFDGTSRVNASGYQLWVLQCARDRQIYGYNNESQTAVLADPTTEVAVGANKILRFQIEVPLAFNAASDLRGALLAQTATGEAQLNIQWNNLFYANGNDDAVYNGAATSTCVVNSITVDVEQEYLLPQSVGGRAPLPMLDLMTVYEIAGAIRTSENIAANTGKLFDYPNLRSVIGFYANFINNSVMNAATTDISTMKLIANGNNILREYKPRTKLFDQRRWCDGDLRKGTYFEMHRDKPIQTDMYGNVQYEITPSTVSGTCNFEVCFESFFTKGSRLPGMSQ